MKPRKSKHKPFKYTILVTEPMVIMPMRRYLERLSHTPSGEQRHGYRIKKSRRGDGR